MRGALQKLSTQAKTHTEKKHLFVKTKLYQFSCIDPWHSTGASKNMLIFYKYEFGRLYLLPKFRLLQPNCDPGKKIVSMDDALFKCACYICVHVHVHIYKRRECCVERERPAGCSPVQRLCFSLEKRERGAALGCNLQLAVQDRESSNVAKEFPTVAKK